MEIVDSTISMLLLTWCDLMRQDDRLEANAKDWSKNSSDKLKGKKTDYIYLIPYAPVSQTKVVVRFGKKNIFEATRSNDFIAARWNMNLQTNEARNKYIRRAYRHT